VTKKRREAFVALIAPIGIDLGAVEAALRQALRVVAYDTNSIRLTDFLTDKADWFDLEYKSEFERYTKYIQAGDKLCELAGRRDVFALYGMARIEAQFPHRAEDVPTNILHIFRQIKRTEEIKTLKEVYGSNILFVACHASRQQRISNLVSKLVSTDRSLDRNSLEASALKIIGTDANERENPNGQRVLDCYAHADFVLDCSSHPALTRSAERFVEAFFGYPFISPSKDEYCSFVAKSASFRSADLSRQVGAAIFGPQCEVISLGCNEVPAAGGGTYWADGEKDFRDFRIGHDSNHKVRTDMVRDLMVRLQDAGWLSNEHAELKPDDLVETVLSDSDKAPGPLSRAMINDVIEYGRMVHAEMNALSDAARFRRSTAGATLFCTTMPCHLCTKLIIAAGITRVVFIEPYYKSLVSELYEDSVSVHEPFESGKVAFEPLRGVTPNAFSSVFKKGRRKKANGTAVTWDRESAEPIFTTSFAYYPQAETRLVAELGRVVKDISEGSIAGAVEPGPNTETGESAASK